MKFILCFFIAIFSFPNANAASNSDSSIIYLHKKNASFKAAGAKVVLRLKGKHTLANAFKNNDFDTLGTPMPQPMMENFQVVTEIFDGRKVYFISPKTGGNGKYILFFHGGAYMRNTFKQHWTFISELINKTQYTIVVPDYPLAPFNTVDDVIPFAENVYDRLRKDTKTENITFMGDSAGGGLSLALSQDLKRKKIPQPNQLILLSPWLDVTMSNPDMPKLEKKDPMLDIEGSVLAGKAYAGKHNTKEYLVSPIYGDLTGLPPISLFTGGDEMLVVDARKFRAMMDEQKIALNYYEYPKMFHCWMIATFLKESEVAMTQITELLK